MSASEFSEALKIAAQLSRSPAEKLVQIDTFFHCADQRSGRLKLRCFECGISAKTEPPAAQLIQYQRPDTEGPKTSTYVLSPVTDPVSMLTALTAFNGVRGVVRKKRQVFLVGQTRVHFDEVDDLGTFLELEVVLLPGQSQSAGEAIAKQLMGKLGIENASLVSGAYIDLIEQSRSTS